jgi:GTPase SAR1 family protein
MSPDSLVSATTPRVRSIEVIVAYLERRKLVITGDSGCGKTTLLRVALGELSTVKFFRQLIVTIF